MWKRIAIGFAGFVLVLVVVAAAVIGPFIFAVERIEADSVRGYHAPFYVYVSNEARKASNRGETVVILVQPNNSGTTSDDPAVHEKDAWWTAFGRSGLADELGVVLLVPAFIRPAEDWKIYTHALDLDVLTTERTDLVRLDLQLLAMIDRARAVLAERGIAVDEKILLQGFSASGMFANRFATLHPDRIRAVASGSPGGWPVAPVARFRGEALNYPAGIADLENLTGKPFDSLAFAMLPQLVVMGTLDENDSIDFRDGWDELAAEQVDRLFGVRPISRWEYSKLFYATTSPESRFLLVDGIGHDRRALQRYSTEFFAEILAADTSQSKVHEERVVVAADRWELIGDYQLPESDALVPAVLMLNQANGDRSAYQDLAQDFARRGIASLRIDMRGHGESINNGIFVPGEHPSDPLIWDADQDIPSLVAFLKGQPGVNPDRIGLIGASYSGEEMAEAGREAGYVKAYVTLSPGSFSDESISGIDKSRVPWLFVSAEKDPFLVEIIAALQTTSHTAEFMIVPGSVHATDILEGQPSIRPRIAEWLSQKLTDR